MAIFIEQEREMGEREGEREGRQKREREREGRRDGGVRERGRDREDDGQMCVSVAHDEVCILCLCLLLYSHISLVHALLRNGH